MATSAVSGHTLSGARPGSCPPSTRPLQWVVANGATRFLGTVCYGAYLSHLPLIYLLIPALGLRGSTRDVLILTAIVVPLSFSIGVVSHTFLEEPFRRLARRRKVQTRPYARPVALSPARG